MKKFLIMFAMIFAVGLVTSPVVEAKKFGGSKSIGKTQQTATSQPTATNTAATNTTPTNTATAPAASAKKGMMGGMLGGLLAGGLLAALFMGEGFENIQIMDILIMALVAFVLFKIIRTVMASKAGAQPSPRPAYAAPGQPNPNAFRQQEQPSGFASSGSNGFAQATSDVPFDLPPGFDLPAFLEGSRSHYKTLQQAWNENDLAKIQEYVSIELYNELSHQRRELGGEQHTEVMYMDAELVRATHTPNLAEVSVKFSGRYRDTAEGVEEDIKEVWHLERNLTQANSPWLIVGIEQ
ncbi:MAG: Tim44 domain-containing protein [Shewanella sp.]